MIPHKGGHWTGDGNPDISFNCPCWCILQIRGITEALWTLSFLGLRWQPHHPMYKTQYAHTRMCAASLCTQPADCF